MITRIDRRHLLLGAGALGAAGLAAPALVRAQVSYVDYPFALGVASGDPLPDGFVIWTRLAPRPLEPGYGMAMRPQTVTWWVAADDGFRTIVREGQTRAWPELGHAVHVEVDGLEAGRPYFYRFEAGGERSPVGRARTAPAAGAAVQSLRYAVAGCQNYEQGLYTAYRHLAREDELDFVFHYGDYIYEGRGNPTTWGGPSGRVASVRRHDGDETFTLDDYRRRYAQYRMDVDLQEAHAAAAWFCSWDDHEVDNNWVQDISQDDVPAELFRLRRAAAFQAWYEIMPVRRASLPSAGGLQMYRRARYGDLLTLHVLDTRQYRTNQPCGDGVRGACDEINDREATVLGATQEAWLDEGLRRSGARWDVLAQQVMVMPMDRRTTAPDGLGGEPDLNKDSWNGYQVARARLLDRLSRHDAAGGVLVLTGDEHQTFVGDLFSDGPRGEGRIVASEIVTTSISSGGDGVGLRPGWDNVLARNPHCKIVDDRRGYSLHTVTPQALTLEAKVVDQVRQPGGSLSTRARFALEAGRPGVQAA